MRYLILLLMLTGCAGVATQKDNGTMTLNRPGVAKFENGASLEVTGMYIPFITPAFNAVKLYLIKEVED